MTALSPLKPAYYCHHCCELVFEAVCGNCGAPAVLASEVTDHDCAILGDCPICDSYDPLSDARVREFLALDAKDAASKPACASCSRVAPLDGEGFCEQCVEPLTETLGDPFGPRYSRVEPQVSPSFGRVSLSRRNAA
jgi:hypothetical protein